MEAQLSGYGFDGKLATPVLFVMSWPRCSLIECESRAQTPTLDEEFAPHWGD